MKPLYWKLLLILGAMIVSASLIVPKSLRKSALVDFETSAQSELSPDTSFNTDNLLKADILFGLHQDVSAGQADLTTSDSNVQNGEFIADANVQSVVYVGLRTIQHGFIMNEAKTVALMLNAGMRPTKSRVID